MTRLWRGSFAARFIAFTLLSLVLSHVAVFLISWDEHGQVMRKAAKGEMLSRCASLVRVLEATPPALQSDILAASNTTSTRYWVSPEGPAGAPAWRKEAWDHLTRPLPRVVFPGHGPVAEPRIEPPADIANAGSPDWFSVRPEAWPLSRPAQFVYLDSGMGMGLAVRMENGTWLNSAFAKPAEEGFWNAQSMTSLGLSALVLTVIATIAARGITQPLRRLARAADAFGRGQPVDPLPETGPEDIRRTAQAFNSMQERLLRFVDDRTRMLAAVGHDLRTPLTSLRLRAEFVSDDDLREKMLSTIAEIQSMTEATLAFLREERTAEPTRTVDLSALVESLCEDLAELGQNVVFTEGPKIGYRCRPAALRRACRNIVENAARYGERARVRIDVSAQSIDILVEDDGPGIPDAELEQVFAPFHRLENSRNRETGGVGLGLSIARTIVRHHGGDVVLTNLRQGLRVTLSLPALEAEASTPGPARAAERPARLVRPSPDPAI